MTDRFDLSPLAVGLDDASLDAAWDAAMELIRADGDDPDAMVRRAGEVLTYYHDHPAPLPVPFAAGGDTLVADYIDGPQRVYPRGARNRAERREILYRVRSRKRTPSLETP